MLQELKVVCLGDSITYGFPYGPEISWVTMLQENLVGQFINRGISGNTTSDMLARFERSVLKHEPTHLIIMGGINDVVWGESLARIRHNIKTMVELALSNNIKVILGMPTAVDDVGWESTLEKLRGWMDEYAQENNLGVIHFERAFYDAKGGLRTDLLMADGGHPTARGYEEMYKQIDLNIFKV